MRQSSDHRTTGDNLTPEVTDAVSNAALELVLPADLDPLMDAIGDARYVLLGEASHGTSEFYTWRTALSRRLITEKQFSFVGVEGDWPDCYEVNRYIKGFPDSGDSAAEILHAFDRWPTWMWANREVIELVEWLHDQNRHLPEEQKAGFYGLDVYSLYESMNAVVSYLEGVDPEMATTARSAYTCFEPFHEDVQAYARATAIVPTSCEDEAVSVLRALRARAPEYRDDGREAYFNAEQNALVARGAEMYYRTMVRGGPMSWNVRDHHMVDTLDRLMQHYGDHARGIVWAHNTHVGDARFTDMSGAGMVNVGQLVRQSHERDGVFIVGLATHHGSVIAGDEWGAPMRRMTVPPARSGSIEDVIHRALGGRDSLFIFGDPDEPIEPFEEPLGNRAIGVVYDPAAERYGNYVPSIVGRRYDALLYIDETRALDPLHMPVHVADDAPETYPSGF
jgi:erythromycin esterase-like protein